MKSKFDFVPSLLLSPAALNRRITAMTKSRNKKKRDDAVSMDVSEPKSVSEAAPEGKNLVLLVYYALVHTRCLTVSIFFLFDFFSHGHY